jgi:hypothetical protein
MAKINFSGDRIKKFFIGNGEKLVLVLTSLLFLAFLYSAITAKPLDDSKSPDAIKRESGQLVASLQMPTWDGPDGEKNKLGLAPPHFKQQADNSMRPIAGQKLKPSHEWDPPLFPELIKRMDPEIFAVEDLQVDAGRGIVPYRPAAAAGGPIARPGGGPGFRPGSPPVGPPTMGGPPMGGGPGRPGFGGEEMARGRTDQTASLPGVHAPGADADRKTYVVITGAVPVEKEVEEFRRRFEYAMPAIADVSRSRSASQYTNQTDSPHYFCFLIDRSEVKDADDKTRNWVPILSKAVYANSDAIKDIGKWFTTAPEIVNPDDVFQPESAGNGNNQFNAYITWPLPPLFLKNWGFEAAHPKVKLNITQEAPQENQPDTTQPGGNLENVAPEARSRFGGPNMPGGPPPGVFHGPGPNVGGPPGPGNRGMYSMQSPDVFVDPYKLFRFVDLTAEPGKTYRYRVQILVYNPNWGLSADCLDPKAIQAGTDKKRLSESPPTETPPITVPHEYQILADSINAPGGRLSELKARINLLAIAKTPMAETPGGNSSSNPDTYVEVVKDLELPLGGIAFLHDAELDKVLDMSTESVRKVEKINVDTDQTVLLDVRNDKPLGDGKAREATEMLLMDGSGNLYNASRAADKLVLDDYQQRTKPPTEMKESSAENANPRLGPTQAGPPRGGPPTGAKGPPRGPGAASSKGPKGKE